MAQPNSVNPYTPLERKESFFCLCAAQTNTQAKAADDTLFYGFTSFLFFLLTVFLLTVVSPYPTIYAPRDATGIQGFIR